MAPPPGTSVRCTNCSAPLDVPLGEVEVLCPFCGSRLRFLPGAAELEVVKTREEMKRRERVEVERAILEKQLRQEELARWRQTAAQVAIAVLPVVGARVGRTLFRTAVGETRGGCGCLIALLLGLVGLFVSCSTLG